MFRPNLDGNEILSVIVSVQNVISSLEGAITHLDSSIVLDIRHQFYLLVKEEGQHFYSDCR